MKIRLAKKIICNAELCRSTHNTSIYWMDRLLDYHHIKGGKDHRITKAISLTNKKMKYGKIAKVDG